MPCRIVAIGLVCGGALLAPVHVITYLNSNDSLYIYINFNIDPASSIEELALKKLGARCIHIVLHFIHYFFRSSAFCLAMGWVGWDFCPLQRGLSIHPTHPRQKAGPGGTCTVRDPKIPDPYALQFSRIICNFRGPRNFRPMGNKFHQCLGKPHRYRCSNDCSNQAII